MYQPNSCPNPKRQDVFLDERAEKHYFHPKDDWDISWDDCCYKCSLYLSDSCIFAPCRSFERADGRVGYYTQNTEYVQKCRTWL